MPGPQILRFGPFSLLPLRRVLLEGAQPLRLGSRAFDLLVALTARAGEVVSGQELLAAVWPNRVVEDGSLRVHIATLRKALGDGQPGRRFIANVPLRGYCFVAPVQSADADVPPLLHDGPLSEAPRGFAPMHRLPLPLVRMVGRDASIAELRQRLAQRRCVTLVGPGGIGKTSVALAVARQMVGSRATTSSSSNWPRCASRSGWRRRWPRHWASWRLSPSRCRRLPRICTTSRGCCWCWTTASTWWPRSPSWRNNCCSVRRACSCW